MCRHYYDVDEHVRRVLPSIRPSEKAYELLIACVNWDNPMANERLRMEDMVYEMLVSYDCACIPLGRTIDQWRAQEPEDAAEAAMKQLFFEFIDAGYIAKEFPLFFHDAICSVQLAGMQLGDQIKEAIDE